MACMGVALLSLHTLGLELDHHLIAVPETEGLPLMRRWHVVNNQAKTLSPAAEEAFRYFILERRRSAPRPTLPTSSSHPVATAT